ncbi:MAG: YdcF family protein [Burkholderiaceae bacterium]|nr:YdcF family protein [Burkholderiaceae bacterium]
MDFPQFALLARRALELLVLPPAAALWLIVLGIWLSAHRARAGRALAMFGVLATLLLSSQAVGQWLIGFVERGAGVALDEKALRALVAGADAPRAIVILGGGLRADERERPQPVWPNARTTARVLHGAWVARITGLPVLVSGGTPPGGETSEAALMKRMLEQQLATPVRWVEDLSLDTAGNARGSAALLLPGARRRIVLVTHAYHMPRALAVFRRAGFTPVPAPLGFHGSPPSIGLLSWLPSAEGVMVNWLAAHEAIGGLWYRLRAP